MQGSCTQFASLPADGPPFSGAPSMSLRQVFWLLDHVPKAFPLSQWPRAYSSSYSGGTAPEFHGVPY
jgi:hypothetical protein